MHDTQAVLPGLVVHRASVEGELFPGQDALAVIDAARRESTRRNHTGTHLLHSALRQVLGDHVRQQGSRVTPEYLRFDFSHHAAVRPAELAAVAEAANTDVLSDAAVEVVETSKDTAEAMGALAFFGDKYGERVRVVRAGPHSTELCGGTHVDALGMIGPIVIVSEASIGSNTRRIFADTGAGSLAIIGERERTLDEAARLLRVEPAGVLDAIGRLMERQRQAEREVQQLPRRPAPARRRPPGGRRPQRPRRPARRRAVQRPAAHARPGHPAPRRPGGGAGRNRGRLQGLGGGGL